MNGQLFALLTSEVDDVSLAVLGRAVTRVRPDEVAAIQRMFVRSQGGRFVVPSTTARIRVRWE